MLEYLILEGSDKMNLAISEQILSKEKKTVLNLYVTLNNKARLQEIARKQSEKTGEIIPISMIVNNMLDFYLPQLEAQFESVE